MPPAEITLEKTTPFGAESERALLGAILLDEKAFSAAAGFLETEDERSIRIIDDLQSSLIEIAGRNSPGLFVPMKYICDDGCSEDALYPFRSRPGFSCRYRAVQCKAQPLFGRKETVAGNRGGKTAETRNGYPNRYYGGLMTTDYLADFPETIDLNGAPGVTRKRGLLIRRQERCHEVIPQ